jgi:hypothetical protein
LKKLVEPQLVSASSTTVVLATSKQAIPSSTPSKTISTTKMSSMKKKIISSSRRQLFRSSSEDDDNDESLSSDNDESLSSDNDDEPIDLKECRDMNLIINIQKILNLVNSMNCSKCNSHGHYDYKATKRLGLSFYISFTCSCGNIIRLFTGNRLETSSKTQMTDLNMLSILAGSLVGLHRTGLKKFLGVMGILPPVQIKSYQQYEQLLSASIEKVAEQSMKVAGDEARLYHHSDDITVSVDGTWLTQGFSSLHGIGTIVTVSDPPKVLDFELLTRHCSTCSGLIGIRQRDGELYAEL